MSKWYVSSTVGLLAVGIVDDPNNPFGIAYVYSAVNSAGVAAGDEIITMADGTYSPTNGLHMPVDGQDSQHVICRSGLAVTGAPTKNKAVVGGTSLGAGVLLDWNKVWVDMFGMVWQNGPSTGIQMGHSASACTLHDCATNDNSGIGVQIFSGANNPGLFYHQSRRNGGNGVECQPYQTSNRPVFYRCDIANNGESEIKLLGVNNNEGSAILLESVLVFDPTAISASTAIVEHTFTALYAFNNLIRDNGDTILTNIDVYGFNQEANGAGHYFGNIISGLAGTTGGTAYGMRDLAGDIHMLGGNIFHDLDTNVSGTIIVDFESSRDTTDPNFASLTDHTPRAYLFEKNFPKFAISTETPKLIPGPVAPSSSGGSPSGFSITSMPSQ